MTGIKCVESKQTKEENRKPKNMIPSSSSLPNPEILAVLKVNTSIEICMYRNNHH